jgi:2-iminobutanoate/2-iminopropanoate deaminase
MSRRTFEIPGIAHRTAPIPMAAMVGPLFHSSGIPPTDPATGENPAEGDAQIAQAFANAATLLSLAGLTPDDVVYMDVFLADTSLRPAVNVPWLQWYPDEHDRPARHVTIRDLPKNVFVQLQIQAFAQKETTP